MFSVLSLHAATRGDPSDDEGAGAQHIALRSKGKEATGSRGMSVKTPLCKLLGCETPVLLAGMGKFAGADLVAEVSKAGGYGVFGSAIAVANEEPEKLEELIRGIGKQCEGKPF